MNITLAKWFGKKDEEKKEIPMTLQPVSQNEELATLDQNGELYLKSDEVSEDTEEKKLVWKAICYSYHTYKRRCQNDEASKMESLMRKYFADYCDVDEHFSGMIKPDIDGKK